MTFLYKTNPYDKINKSRLLWVKSCQTQLKPPYRKFIAEKLAAGNGVVLLKDKIALTRVQIELNPPGDRLTGSERDCLRKKFSHPS